MGTQCYAMVRGRVARFTLLDVRGNPISGAHSTVVSKGVSTVSITEVSDTGTGLSVQTANDAEASIYLPAQTSTVYYNADLDLVGVDPDLVGMLTGYPVVLNAQGDRVGNDVIVRPVRAHYAMEVWSKIAGRSDIYGYTIFPRLSGGRVTGLTFGDASVSFKISGARTSGNPNWLHGPYGLEGGWDSGGWDTGGWDVASDYWMPAISPTANWRQGIVDSIPEPTCGAIALA